MDLLTALEETCTGISYSVGNICRNGSGNGRGGSSSSSDGNGNGWGSGFGVFYGSDFCSYWGYGNGYGWSNGWGDGRGYGEGDGGGDNSNGYGSGTGRGDVWMGIAEIDGMKVYVIDNMLTAIETAFGDYAKGYTIGNGAVLAPCYVVLDGSSLAHGKTLKEAFRDARAKEMKKLPEEARVKRFVTEHPEPEENLPNEDLFYIHHTLTGSCEFGRREFCRKNNINLESSMSISEFLTLTEKEYGGEIIRKIREEYSRRG